ncbi:hypothetical protein [Pseudonocardia sp.]|uniref:hypothetical protein n=1 Tax=Pseudonocardia sp. TaxID=60912 RepID=UPI003D0B200F
MSRPTDAHATTTTEGTMQDRLDDPLDQRHHEMTDPRAAEAGGPGGWGGPGESHDAGAAGHAAPAAHPESPRTDRDHATDGHATDGYASDGHAPQGESRAARLSEPSAVPEAGTEENALIPRQRAADYQDRWQVLKAQFVDEPRTAVREANELVGRVLDEIEETFRTQRSDLERDLHDDTASTEDLRLALGRYRTFFDRLLSF